jgi:hypothetical protein
MVRIRSLSDQAPDWWKRVDVFIRTAGEGLVIGIDRES